jgi:hypothetical protein
VMGESTCVEVVFFKIELTLPVKWVGACRMQVKVEKCDGDGIALAL